MHGNQLFTQQNLRTQEENENMMKKDANSIVTQRESNNVSKIDELMNKQFTFKPIYFQANQIIYQQESKATYLSSKEFFPNIKINNSILKRINTLLHQRYDSRFFLAGNSFEPSSHDLLQQTFYIDKVSFDPDDSYERSFYTRQEYSIAGFCPTKMNQQNAVCKLIANQMNEAIRGVFSFRKIQSSEKEEYDYRWKDDTIQIRYGFLSMDQNHRIMPFCASDDCCVQLPLIGIWSYGIKLEGGEEEDNFKAKRFLWSLMVEFVKNKMLAQRFSFNKEKGSFLLILFNLDESPSYYEVSLYGDSVKKKIDEKNNPIKFTLNWCTLQSNNIFSPQPLNHYDKQSEYSFSFLPAQAVREFKNLKFFQQQEQNEIPKINYIQQKGSISKKSSENNSEGSSIKGCHSQNRNINTQQNSPCQNIKNKEEQNLEQSRRSIQSAQFPDISQVEQSFHKQISHFDSSKLDFKENNLNYCLLKLDLHLPPTALKIIQEQQDQIQKLQQQIETLQEEIYSYTSTQTDISSSNFSSFQHPQSTHSFHAPLYFPGYYPPPPIYYNQSQIYSQFPFQPQLNYISSARIDPRFNSRNLYGDLSSDKSFKIQGYQPMMNQQSIQSSTNLRGVGQMNFAQRIESEEIQSQRRSEQDNIWQRMQTIESTDNKSRKIDNVERQEDLKRQNSQKKGSVSSVIQNSHYGSFQFNQEQKQQSYNSTLISLVPSSLQSFNSSQKRENGSEIEESRYDNQRESENQKQKAGLVRENKENVMKERNDKVVYQLQDGDRFKNSIQKQQKENLDNMSPQKSIKKQGREDEEMENRNQIILKNNFKIEYEQASKKQITQKNLLQIEQVIDGNKNEKNKNYQKHEKAKADEDDDCFLSRNLNKFSKLDNHFTSQKEYNQYSEETQKNTQQNTLKQQIPDMVLSGRDQESEETFSIDLKANFKMNIDFLNSNRKNEDDIYQNISKPNNHNQQFQFKRSQPCSPFQQDDKTASQIPSIKHFKCESNSDDSSNVTF